MREFVSPSEVRVGHVTHWGRVRKIEASGDRIEILCHGSTMWVRIDRDSTVRVGG